MPEAGLFGGGVKFGADISLAKGASGFSASVAPENVDFPALTKLYFDFDTARGQLSGTFDFKMRGADARTMEGAGKLQLANGTVFTVPVFGPLSSLMSSIIPGSGHSVQREASASFTIRDGVINTKTSKSRAARSACAAMVICTSSTTGSISTFASTRRRAPASCSRRSTSSSNTKGRAALEAELAPEEILNAG
jgi:hypothetical protein